MIEDRDNLYVGPRPFKTGEKLYARERESTDLINLLLAERIVLLFSPSGGGKTSLIQAVVAPAMQEEGFEVLPVIRVSHASPRRAGASDGNRYLASTRASLEQPDAEQATETHSKKESAAQDTSMDLAAYLDRNAGPRDTEATQSFRPQMLIFDQFEEILTLDPTDIEAKQEFFRQVGQALRNRDRWALFSMREDYVAALDPYLSRIPTQFAATYRLDLLGAKAALQAAQLPARDAGVEFHDDVANTLVDDLRTVNVQRADGGIQAQLGPYVEPVHLQVVCRSLWRIKGDSREITLAHLEKLSGGKGTGVDAVLGGYYAETAATAATEGQVSERLVRDWFGQRLIGAGDVRRPVLQSEALEFGLTPKCLDVLDKAFLIRREFRSGAQWYELAHDRLMTPVLKDNESWRHEHLSTFQLRAELWSERGRPEDLLLSGKALTEAEANATADGPAPTEVEEAFLQNSLESRDKLLAEQEHEHQLQRNRKLRYIVGAGIVVVLILGAATVLTTIFAIEADKQKRQADKHAEEVEAAEIRASWLAYAGHIAQAKRNFKDQDLRLAWQQLDATREEYRGWEYDYVRSLLESDQRTFLGFGASVNDVAFSPDGTWIACASDDQTVRIADVATRRILHTFEGHTDVTSVAFSPDGKWIVSGDRDKTLRIWDASERSDVPLMTLTGHDDWVTDVAFSPDGQWIVSGSKDTTVKVWDATTGQLRWTLEGHDGAVTSVAVSPDGKWIVSGGAHGLLAVWDATEGQLQRTPEYVANALTAVAFSPDSQYILSGSEEGRVERWDQETGKFSKGWDGHRVSSVAYRPDGERIVAGYRNGKMIEWDVDSDERTLDIKAHTGVITGVAYSPTDQRIVSASTDCMLRIWDGPPARDDPRLTGHWGQVWWVAFGTDGQWFVSAGADEKLRIWDAATDKTRETLHGHTKGVWAADVSPDNQRIVSGSADTTLRIWDVTTGETLHTLHGHKAEVGSVAYSADGQSIISASYDGTIKLWDATTGGEIRTFDGHDGKVTSVVFSPDGKRIISGGDDGTLKVWETTTGTEPFTIPAHEKPIWCVAVSPDGKSVVSGGVDNTLKLWDLATSENTLTFSGHTAWVTSVAFSPDGKRIVSGSEDNTVRLWELTTGQTTLVLRGHYDTVWGVAFSPDGKRIISGSEDWTIGVWDAAAAPEQTRSSNESGSSKTEVDRGESNDGH